ncbi:TPA: ATP-dependent nuclease [Legionella pneumophila]
MKYIEKIKLLNFKRFKNFVYAARKGRNIFIGDNEAGKSTILQAIDLVLSGSRSRIEAIGLDTLFNRDIIQTFLKGTKELTLLPRMEVEIYLNDQQEISLEGKNNTEQKTCQGLKLTCEAMIDEYSQEIKEALSNCEAIFPFEYYNIQLSTFSGQLYSQNRRYLNHVLIDSSLITSEYAMREYTKSLYEAHTTLVDRYQHSYAYRHSKDSFSTTHLGQLNKVLEESKFNIKNDNKSNLINDLVITQGGIPINHLGKGEQCFIKSKFALQKKEGKKPLDLILIEEPENHLSHVNMKKLINEIDTATQTQIFIATHSNSVCSRLDLHNASIVGAKESNPITLADLPIETANYFIKAPNNKILEFVLSQKVILVEGDVEYMLIQGMYENCHNIKLEDSKIHVIAVGGTCFKPYLELAKLLKIKTAVIRDNDGNYQYNCVDDYASYTSTTINIFSDMDDQKRTTLEKCIYQDNQKLCDDFFKQGRRTLSVEDYMLSNKTDCSLKILESGMKQLVTPNYIKKAFKWIRE